jgi:hypothetical protein
VRHFFETNEEFLLNYAEETMKGCPFCPPNVEKTTPRFPAELVGGEG